MRFSVHVYSAHFIARHCSVFTVHSFIHAFIHFISSIVKRHSLRGMIPCHPSIFHFPDSASMNCVQPCHVFPFLVAFTLHRFISFNSLQLSDCFHALRLCIWSSFALHWLLSIFVCRPYVHHGCSVCTSSFVLQLSFSRVTTIIAFALHHISAQFTCFCQLDRFPSFLFRIPSFLAHS